MSRQIRIGILGYGNLGKGVECAIKQNPDMKLAAVFTRRDPETVSILTEGVKVYRVEEAAQKFVRSVAEGNSKYARELFIDEAVLFGYLKSIPERAI